MSNTVNRFGLDMGIWISYTETQKSNFNRKYQLIFDRKYEFLDQFEGDCRKELEENFEKVAAAMAKIITDKLA